MKPEVNVDAPYNDIPLHHFNKHTIDNTQTTEKNLNQYLKEKWTKSRSPRAFIFECLCRNFQALSPVQVPYLITFTSIYISSLTARHEGGNVSGAARVTHLHNIVYNNKVQKRGKQGLCIDLSGQRGDVNEYRARSICASISIWVVMPRFSRPSLFSSVHSRAHWHSIGHSWCYYVYSTWDEFVGLVSDLFI